MVNTDLKNVKVGKEQKIHVTKPLKIIVNATYLVKWIFKNKKYIFEDTITIQICSHS